MATHFLFLPLIIMFFTLREIQADMPYDYSFTNECLVKPLKPQYGGGIVGNLEHEQGLRGWTQVGDAKLERRTSSDGTNYIVASVCQNRTSTIQNFYLEAEKLYAFSAWLQVSNGSTYIKASFKIDTTDEAAGWVATQRGCWSMLKGGIVVNASTSTELFFETDIPTAEIWITSISLQPFTHEEWKSHRNQSIEMVRRGKVKFQVIDERDKPITNVNVSIKQTQPQFPFGNVMNTNILETPAYAKWFVSRFRYTVFENELKWTTTEERQGFVNYTLADAMISFTRSHGLIARGHTVLWDSKDGNPQWVANLTKEGLREATNSRVDSVMNKYKKQFIHWDVVNENLHNRYLEDILGEDASTLVYKRANEIDPEPLLFLNEYATLEKARSLKASPWKYLQKIWELRSQGYKGYLGIGLQSHFVELNLPYVRASIDVLHSVKFPVWITELDVSNVSVGSVRQVDYLEELLREFHAHEAVQGIMMWSGWRPNGTCYKMCLTDDNFENLPTGDVVDKIIAEWTYATGVQGTTSADGCFQTSLYYGEYEATISDPGLLTTRPNVQRFKVVPHGNDTQNVIFKILA